MTTLTHDDTAPTPVEDAVARMDGAAGRLVGTSSPSARATGAAAVAQRRGHRGVRTAPTGAPRLRLVPTLPPVRPGTAPDLRLPLALAERATPRVLEDVEERGAVPVTDARRFVHGVGLACLEVVLGRRPAAQLARWVTPEVLENLQVRADLVRRTGVLAHARRPAALRVRVCPVDSHTAEACLVVDDGVRVRALAARLEAHRGSWRVTTLQIG